MECEEHGLLTATEQLSPALIADGLVVLADVLDLEQVDHVDEPHLNAQLAHDIGCSQGLERRHVAARGDHDVSLGERVGSRCPLPNRDTLGELGLGLVDRLEGGGGLLATEDGVDAVGGLVDALGHSEGHIGVGRIVSIHDMRVVGLVEQQVDKTGVLVREAVVVLAPHVARQQNVEAADGSTPRNLALGGLEPFAVLVDHGIDDVDKALVGAPHAGAAGEHVGLEEALALVLGQLLDNLAGTGQQLVVGLVLVKAGIPLLLGHLVGSLQAVGRGLVGTEDAEVVHVLGQDVGSVLAKDAGGLGGAPAVTLTCDGNLVGMNIGQFELAAHLSAVRVGVGADAQLAGRHKGRHLGAHLPLGRKELLGLVGAQPLTQHAEVLVGVLGTRQRNLMGAPGVLGLLAVDVLGASPALGRAEHDHGIGRADHGLARGCLGLSGGLDVADLVKDLLKQGSKTRMNAHVVLVVKTGDKEVRLVAHALKELGKLFVGHAGEDGGIGDLVTVEVQDWQNDTVGCRVHELVGLPRGRERTGLGLAVAHHGHGQQARVVHDGAVGVAERVAELAALVDGAGRLGRKVARDATGIRELAEELLQASLVIGDVGTNLTVGAIEQRLGGAGRATVARAHQENSVLVVIGNEAVDVAEQEVNAGRGAPVTDQAVLNVRTTKVAHLTGLLVNKVGAHQRVGAKVNLADGQVVRCAPIQVDALELGSGNLMSQFLPRRSQCFSHCLCPFAVWSPSNTATFRWD